MKRNLIWIAVVLAVVSLFAGAKSSHVPKTDACVSKSECASSYSWESPLLK
ncbi:MAG: hypothetical protein KIT45_09370 [Fimbriimonadia bacterium]|nr:hypothetical protein [Fimbriimonadia bacterium]